ncbi:hypothetical protein FSP39_005417 [Pinctada imbricata]|uniref:CSC1-like protein 2 n=1 Tax=Pinctada imbricata TaxID=66713 RepID=A0AA88XTJ3_PINIB|nr:hypothetical protein FSP39_005417 [Pinctada imbricata]
MGDADSGDSCGTFTFKNKTVFDPTNGTYEGIPFNLIINSCAFVFLIMLFAVLRKLAWDYGRIALVSRAEEKWTSLFYGEHDNKSQQMGSVESIDAHIHSQDKNICSWIPAFIRVKDNDILQKSGKDAIQYLSFQRYLIIYTVIITVLFTYRDNDILQKSGKDAIQYLSFQRYLIIYTVIITVLFTYRDNDILQKSGKDAIQYLSFQRYLIIYTVIITVLFTYRDNDILQKSGKDAIQYLSFHRYLIIHTVIITVLFTYRDNDILQKSGKDAIQYLSFQRYLIIYTVIITVLSIAIIVPVNFSGNNIGNATDFGHTTIGNLDPETPLLWIHSILAVFFLILLIALMRHFRLNLEFQEDEQVSRTLMITNIPTKYCYKNSIVQHFQEAYSGEVTVTDVQFAYNISKLVALDQKRKVAEEARNNSELEYDRTGVRPMMRPMFCGQCCCCCGVKEVDAMEHYAHLEQELTQQCEQEKVTAYQDPLGIAFVTFQNDVMAGRVRMDFRASCKGVNNPQNSSIDLDVTDWEVKYAPSPENIYWENLSKSPWKWRFQAVIINLFVIILLFFFTTPLIVLNNLNEINYLKPIEEHSPFLVDFLPTLLLWTFTALLPNVVYWSDQLIGHWTRTSEHHAIMVKTFVFLLLMVLILPSLGLTSAKALFEWFVLTRENSFRWKCIFVANHGAFFVNYVITAAFIGSALELLRFSELFMYGLRLSLAHSSAEKTAIRKSLVWEFMYGVQYAWTLCVFAVTMAYCLLCPLVTPFGLVYMCLKHLVDRYNIYFAYKPSKISKGIHKTAINFVTVSVILTQFNIVFFTALRSESVNPVFVFSSAVLFVTLVWFVGRVGFGWFKNLSLMDKIKYRPFGDDENASAAPEQSTTGAFVPSVLQDNRTSLETRPSSTGATFSGRGTTGSYGTLDSDRGGSSYDSGRGTAYQGTMGNTDSTNSEYDVPPGQHYQ